MTTMDDPRPIVYPNDNYNTLMVRDILEHSETNLDSIRETGAVIRVRTDWDCDITWSYGCSPDMDTKRLDTVGDGDPTGFVMMR